MHKRKRRGEDQCTLREIQIEEADWRQELETSEKIGHCLRRVELKFSNLLKTALIFDGIL